MKKVLVAMSGGVDSSVAAALLQKQGYSVVGAYMKNFSPESWEGILQPDCPWEQDTSDAIAVCKKLGIEFRSFNFEKEYREKVIEYFFAEYAAGRTPNPDVMCNKEIKFGLFMEKANELGFDYIATGHYARVNKLRIKNYESRFELFKGLDPKKDQSYFLYALTQKQLSKTLFPIGEHTKPQVRQIAHKLRLPNAEKKDSQGVCFVGKIKLQEFLRQRIPERVGEIVTSTGEIIGQHQGAAYFTIGQREGIKVGGGVPYYVMQKDMVANRVTVARGRQNPSIYSSQIKIKNIHWIAGNSPKLPVRCGAKIRYQQEDQECEINPAFDGYEINFAAPQFAVAPGQAVVFYEGNKALGGGVIEKASLTN